MNEQNKPKTQLSDAQMSRLLLKLGEECAEVAHAVLKFAGEQTPESQAKIAAEMGHVSAMFTHCLSNHLIDSKAMWEAYYSKHKKWVEKLSTPEGTVDNDSK